MMSLHNMPDVIVLIPGLLGSALTKNGKPVWSYSGLTIGSAFVTFARTVQEQLALPYDDPERDDLGDGIVADRLMPDLHLLPDLWKIDGYDRIVETLFANFKLAEGENFICFPYDWRRDNRVSARKLARSTDKALKAWREKSGNADAKLILIAHSMGGLVARYFLECLDGSRDTRALITFGTPFRGSLKALNALTNGIRLCKHIRIAAADRNVSTLLRQFTSLYQLLPTFPCIVGADGTLSHITEAATIPNLDVAKAADARNFHHEIEAGIAARLARNEIGYQIYPVVGIAQDTFLSARWDKARLTMSTTYPGYDFAGDGVVPRISGTPIDLGDSPANTLYVGTTHASIQNANAVLQHVIGVLSGFNLPLRVFRKSKTRPMPAFVKVSVPDILFSDEAFAISADPSHEVAGMRLTVQSIVDRRVIYSGSMSPGLDGGFLSEKLHLKPGAYRIHIDGAAVQSVDDAFAVLAVTSDEWE